METLAAGGKYDLTIWPFHAMLGGIGHAFVSAVEEALFFHADARSSQTRFEIKGEHPLTEHYSVLGPRSCGAIGRAARARNAALVEHLLGFDAVLVAGQAKSHCVAWTVADLLLDVPRDRAAPVPARGLLVAGRRAGDRLHRRCGRRLRPLRGGGSPRRPLDGAIASWPGPLAAAAVKDALEPLVRAEPAPTFAAGLPSATTTSAVKSFSPRISEEPTP